MALYNPLLIKKLKEHIQKNPKSKSFCTLAQMYFSMGDLEKAEELCDQGLKHHPSFSQAYVILGQIYKSQDKLEKAIQFFNKAKALNPDNPHVYKNLVEIYKLQNNLEKTLEAYKMINALLPEDQTAVSHIQHLEKLINSSDVAKNLKPSSQVSLSEEKIRRLARLNQILARMEVCIQESKGK